MEVEISVNRSVDENAAAYFETAKKAKKKIEGIEKAIGAASRNLEKIEAESAKKEQEKSDEIKKPERKKEWYENFRWFFTSSGLLVIGGRDATTNEIIIKKHTEDDDIVFHTDMSGSPFVVLKTGSEKATDMDIEEAGQFTVCFSKAWKLGLSSSEVFYISPEQVSKTVKAGEYMGKGSFMIYGKRNYLRPVLKLAVGNVEGRIECAPPSALKPRTKEVVEISQGSEKTSRVAKKIKGLIGGELDEIIRVLPPGGARVAKGSRQGS